MRTVVETPAYLNDAERLLSREERAAIVDMVSADPLCGALFPGRAACARFALASKAAANAVAHE
jgi:hypothetical protein